jgi:hypothetical protein
VFGLSLFSPRVCLCLFFRHMFVVLETKTNTW